MKNGAQISHGKVLVINEYFFDSRRNLKVRWQHFSEIKDAHFCESKRNSLDQGSVLPPTS